MTSRRLLRRDDAPRRGGYDHTRAAAHRSTTAMRLLFVAATAASWCFVVIVVYAPSSALAIADRATTRVGVAVEVEGEKAAVVGTASSRGVVGTASSTDDHAPSIARTTPTVSMAGGEQRHDDQLLEGERVVVGGEEERGGAAADDGADNGDSAADSSSSWWLMAFTSWPAVMLVCSLPGVMMAANFVFGDCVVADTIEQRTTITGADGGAGVRRQVGSSLSFASRHIQHPLGAHNVRRGRLQLAVTALCVVWQCVVMQSYVLPQSPPLFASTQDQGDAMMSAATADDRFVTPSDSAGSVVGWSLLPFCRYLHALLTLTIAALLAYCTFSRSPAYPSTSSSSTRHVGGECDAAQGLLSGTGEGPSDSSSPVVARRWSRCRSCGCDVLDMDHHCFWIHNCVARHNRRAFLALLGLSLVTSLGCLGSIMMPLRPDAEAREETMLDEEQQQGVRDDAALSLPAALQASWEVVHREFEKQGWRMSLTHSSSGRMRSASEAHPIAAASPPPPAALGDGGGHGDSTSTSVLMSLDRLFPDLVFLLVAGGGVVVTVLMACGTAYLFLDQCWLMRQGDTTLNRLKRRRAAATVPRGP